MEAIIFTKQSLIKKPHNFKSGTVWFNQYITPKDSLIRLIKIV
jgi:hypothetical protein